MEVEHISHRMKDLHRKVGVSVCFVINKIGVPMPHISADRSGKKSDMKESVLLFLAGFQ